MMAVGQKIDADLNKAQSFRIGGSFRPHDRQEAVNGPGGAELHERHHVCAARNASAIQVRRHCPAPVPTKRVLLPASRSVWMGAGLASESSL